MRRVPVDSLWLGRMRVEHEHRRLVPNRIAEEISMPTTELKLAPTGPATLSSSATMKALVYHGPGKHVWEDRPRPTLQDPGDAIVRITTSTICGTDLHILKGDLPAVTDGRILGHEGIGVIEHVGPGVSEFHVGNRVIISCVTACLKCDFCRRGMYSHCRHGGMVDGFWAIPSTGPRPSMFASRKLMGVCTTSRPVGMKKPWLCSATSCRRVLSAAS